MSALREVAAPLEVRVSGRTLRAEVPYGERARDRAEQFAPGSLRVRPDAVLNLQHDRMFEVASRERRTLRLTDGPDAMLLEADLQGAPLDLVRRGALRGISPEFYARRERREAGLRVIEHADVPAFGLVDIGSYATPLELRRRSNAWKGAWLNAVIPEGHQCSCECAGRDCQMVVFERGSLEELVDDDAADVVATSGRLVPENILGSKAAGTLLLAHTSAGVALGLTEARTPAAASVRAAAAVSEIHARPLIDVEASESTVSDGVRTYTAAHVTAILVKTAPPDRRIGWEPADIDGADPEARAHRRRLWL